MVREACQRAANSLAEQGKVGASDVKLVGNGEAVLTAGLVSGSRPCVIESGLPKFGNLPEPPVFYGRGEELVQLSQSFTDAGLTGFGLWGIGGIGKTALAKVAARRNAWRYEGAVWVDIRDATQKTTAELLRLALCRLHPGAPDADPAFELARRLQDAPSLIVLDNLEDLAESEHAALARFLQQVPKNGSRALLTARVPLPAVERLPDVQSRRMTEGLDTWNGGHLLQHVAQQRQCLALKDELREVAGKPEGLCVLVTQRLHGHPMMLELAVGVALRGRKQLEQALVELPDDLEEQLAALLATSLQYLGDDGNRVLPLLSFFPTGNLTPEALDVAGRSLTLRVEPSGKSLDSESQATEESDDDTEPDLLWLTHGREHLVAAGLLEYDQARDVYTFHQSILDEAHRRRPSDEVCLAITVALLQHFAEYVRSNSHDNDRLDRCFENAVVLMESLWSGRDGDSPLDAVLANMIDSLGNYFQHRGLWRLGQTWHERAIELRRSSSHAQNDARLAAQYFHQGQILTTSSQPKAAREALNEALRIYEHVADQRGIGVALHQLAIIESAHGNPSEARRLLQRSLAIKESLGDQLGLAASLNELGRIEAMAGNRDEARNLWERSIRMKESIGDVAGAAATKSNLAHLEAMESRFERAIELASQAVRELEQRGYAQAEQAREVLRSVEQAAARRGTGNATLHYAERLQQTLTAWKSLSPAERLDEARSSGSSAKFEPGNALELILERNFAEAEPLLERALAQARAAGNSLAVATCQFYLGGVALKHDRPADAVSSLREALELATQVGETDLIHAVQDVLTVATQAAGNQ